MDPKSDQLLSDSRPGGDAYFAGRVCPRAVARGYRAAAAGGDLRRDTGADGGGSPGGRFTRSGRTAARGAVAGLPARGGAVRRGDVVVGAGAAGDRWGLGPLL